MDNDLFTFCVHLVDGVQPEATLNLEVLEQPVGEESPGHGFLWDETDADVVRASELQLKGILKLKSSDESSSDDAGKSPLSPDSEWFRRSLSRKRSYSEGGQKSRRAHRASDIEGC